MTRGPSPSVAGFRPRFPSGLGASLWQRLPILGQYVASTGSLVVSNVAQLVTFAILARSLGAQQFGLLVTLTAVTSLAVQLCGLGATETLVRRVAAEPKLYRSALGHNLILTGASGLVLVTVLCLVLPHVFVLSPDPVRNALALTMLVVANVLLVRVVVLAEQICIALWKFTRANLILAGFSVVRVLGAALGCLVFGAETVEEWAVWHLASHLVMAGLCLLAVWRFGRPRWVILREEVKLGFYFCTPFFFLALRQNADLIVLGAVASPEIVGAYGIARRISDCSYLTVNGMHRLVYPRLAAAATRGMRAAFPLALKVFALGGAIALATAIAIYVAAPLVALVFGPQYAAIVPYLQVLAWLGLFVMCHDVAASFLGACARHGLRAAIYNGVSLVGAGLIALLTYSYVVPGTLTALYIVEATLAVIFWASLLTVLRRQPH